MTGLAWISRAGILGQSWERMVFLGGLLSVQCCAWFDVGVCSVFVLIVEDGMGMAIGRGVIEWV